jgi:hypothetical protein
MIISLVTVAQDSVLAVAHMLKDGLLLVPCWKLHADERIVLVALLIGVLSRLIEGDSTGSSQPPRGERDFSHFPCLEQRAILDFAIENKCQAEDNNGPNDPERANHEEEENEQEYGQERPEYIFSR